MKKIVFLNNEFLENEKAFIHIEDRAFQLGDGIYEVILYENNKLIDFDNHIKRLIRSSNEINLKINQDKLYYQNIFLELFKINKLNSGSVYLQITRGSNARIQNFPQNYNINITASVKGLKKSSNNSFAITHEDIRWMRCDIKSTSLLANSFLKEKAVSRGCIEAILIRDNFISEGCFSNLFIVNENNEILTRKSSNFILSGVTRNRIIELAKNNNLKVKEILFTKEDLYSAKEVFITSSTLKIKSITKIDNKIIGDGKIGKITKELSNLYNSFIYLT